MTTTIAKGTLKPAAAARTAKAAQRTPLPADLTKMTIAQLRELAVQRGLSTSTKLTKKAQLIAAIERVTDTKPARKFASLAAEAETALAVSKSAPKANALRDFLAPYGWKASTEINPGEDVVVLTAQRGTEVLSGRWVAGRWSYHDSLYTSGDRKRKLLNASAARQLCGVAAE